jgi:hypothetical protein
VYVIVKRLPERDGEFEYQIKNLAEPDERVVRESQLRPNPWHRTGRLAGYRQCSGHIFDIALREDISHGVGVGGSQLICALDSGHLSHAP